MIQDLSKCCEHVSLLKKFERLFESYQDFKNQEFTYTTTNSTVDHVMKNACASICSRHEFIEELWDKLKAQLCRLK